MTIILQEPQVIGVESYGAHQAQYKIPRIATMSSYDHLSKEQLIALLQRREREASYGLVWEQDFVMFREEDDQLHENGRFETSRLRWDN